MSRVTYRLDTVAFREELLNAPWMVEEMRVRAEAAKALFQAIAPTGDPKEDPHPGAFRGSVHVVSGRDGGVKHDRAFGRLESDDPLALSKEYGHVAVDGTFVSGSHALVRSMDAMGGHGSAKTAQFHGAGTRRRKKLVAAAKRRATSAAKRAAESPEDRAARLTAAAQRREAKRMAKLLEQQQADRRAKGKRR